MSLLTTGPRLRVRARWVSSIPTLCMTELLKYCQTTPPVLDQNCTCMMNIRAYCQTSQVSRRHVPTYCITSAKLGHVFFCYRRTTTVQLNDVTTRANATCCYRNSPRHYSDYPL